MIKMFLHCDYCGYRDNTEELTREWLTLNENGETSHFCSRLHAKMYLEKEKETK